MPGMCPGALKAPHVELQQLSPGRIIDKYNLGGRINPRHYEVMQTGMMPFGFHTDDQRPPQAQMVSEVREAPRKHESPKPLFSHVSFHLSSGDSLDLGGVKDLGNCQGVSVVLGSQ